VWTVTLVCGAAGVGKSTIAAPLASRYGTPLGEVDDIVTALRAMTTGEQQPLLHYWDTHPQVKAWPPEKVADLHLSVADAVEPGLSAVITDHVASRAPVVFEGDYLLPELATGYAGGAVRAVVIDEPDEDQIVANYLAREPHLDEQRNRARISTLVGARLAERAVRCGVAVVPARPWSDLLDRVDSALRGLGHGAP
jgi:2-phosphoglycerate kinase